MTAGQAGTKRSIVMESRLHSTRWTVFTSIPIHTSRETVKCTHTHTHTHTHTSQDTLPGPKVGLNLCFLSANHGSCMDVKERFGLNRNKNLLKGCQFSRSVVSDSLQPLESQHARPPSPTPGVHPNSCPLTRWCHPAISSSVIPFSSCPQSLPVSEFFPMSQLFAWGGQSIGVSALASVLPKNTQDWSPLPCHALKPEVLKVRAWTEYYL